MLLGLAGLVLNVVPLFAGSVAFGAAAQTGYLLAVVLIGGTWAHRWWYFGPTRAFRRELGGPDGWLDHHDLARSAGERGVRAAAPPGSGSGPAAPVTDYGWQVGRLVSGGLRVAAGVAAAGLAAGAVAAELAAAAAGGVLAVGARVRRGRPAGQRQDPVPGQRGARRPRRGGRPVDQAGVGGADPPAARAGRADRGVQPVAARRDRVGLPLGPDLRLHRPTDSRTAAAWALVRGSGGAAGIDRADFWAGKAQEILRCYLLAAALDGADMTR